MASCECEYSYTCDMHREMASLEREDAYQTERADWIVDSIKKIAEHLKIELDEEPKKGTDSGYW